MVLESRLPQAVYPLRWNAPPPTGETSSAEQGRDDTDDDPRPPGPVMLKCPSRSRRWCGSQAMTAHDFAEHFDVRRAIASKDDGDITEVARAQ